MRYKRNRKRREELTPEMTPLMDIMFLLLIFFIVTSVFRKNESILALSLPKIEGGVAQGQKKELMTIELSTQSLAVNKKVMEFEEFAKLCAGVKNPKMNVDFRVDKTVIYQRVIKVLDILQKNNLSNLSLVNEK
jgi:biopolymer transport protein ExbD